MVSKEVAKASHDAQQKANEEAKAKQDAIISSSKQSRFDNRGYVKKDDSRPDPLIGTKQSKFDNRGYNYSDTTSDIAHGNDPTTGKWSYNKLNQNITGKVPDKIKQNLDREYEDKKNKQSDFSTQRGFNYSDTTGNIYHGNSPENGAWAYDPVTQESFGNVPDEIRKKDSFNNSKSSPLNEIGYRQTEKVRAEKLSDLKQDQGFQKTEKIRAEKLSDIKKISNQENEEFIIKKRNEMVERNNEVATDYWIQEGKKLGFKEVKIKTASGTKTVSIDDKAIYDFENNLEMSFVNTPEMIQENRNLRKEQKEFLRYGKNAGYKEIRIKTKDSTEIVPIEQGYRAIVNSPSGAEITFVNTPEKRTENLKIRKEQKEYFENLKKQNYKQFYIKTPENGIEVKDIEHGYREIIHASPDAEIKPIEYPSREQSLIPKDEFSQRLFTLEKHVERSKNPVVQFFGSALVEVGSGIANIRNLIKPRSEFQTVNGTKQLVEVDNNDWYAGKPSVPQEVIGSPIKVGAEILQNENTTKKDVIENLEDFRSKTKQEWFNAGYQAMNQPVPKTLGQTFGFVFSVVPNRVKEALPIKITRTPIYTSEGLQTFVTTARVGYGQKTLLIGGRYGQTGKFFVRTQKPEISGIEKISGPSGNSSFETYEFSEYSARQLQDIKPSIEYAEKTGVIAKGDFESVIQKGNVQKKIASNKKMFEYDKSINPKEFEQEFQGAKGETLTEIAKQQSKGNLDVRKGSSIINALKGGIKTKSKDIDFTSESEKKGLIASEELYNIGAKEGYVLRQKGTNISIGEVDKNKPFWNLLPFVDKSRGSFIRGDAEKFSIKFVKNPNPTNLPRSELFLSNSSEIAKRFAKRNALLNKSKESYINSEIDMDKILKFGDLSKRDRAKIISDDWFEFQTNMKNEAIARGKLGYTKPYLSNDVNFPKYEIVIFDKDAILGSKLIKPTSYGILEGTERDFINIVTPKDDKVSLLGKLSDTFFGKKIKTSTLKQNVGTSKYVIKSQDFPQQVIDWGRSSSGVISKNTLTGYRGDSSEFEILFDKAKVRLGYPVPHRIQKDLTREYFFGLRESARFAFESGKKEFAKEIGLVMNKQYFKYKDIINWKDAIKEFKNTEGTFVIKQSSRLDKLKNIGSMFRGKESQDSIRSSILAGSSKSIDASLNNYSLKSLFSKYNIGSTKFTSINNKSIESYYIKNIKPESIASSKFSKSNSKSLASIKSVKSPNSKSYDYRSVGSKSVTSPSVNSPNSPHITSVTSPSLGSFNLKSSLVPVVKNLNFKFVPNRTRPFILLKLDFAKKPRTYSDKPKFSITFRWSVKNPIFKKFSISEGKRKRRLEW